MYQDLPETDEDFVEERDVAVEVETKGIDGGRGTDGPGGILGPRGTDLLTTVLVKVELPGALVSVGVVRFSSLDVSGSCIWIE